MSQKGKSIDSQAAYHEALLQGASVLVPASDQLFVDIDSEEESQVYSAWLGRINAYLKLVEISRLPSSSGELFHDHIILKAERPLTNMERILLQVLLGSDKIREYLSWARTTKNDPVPTLFIEGGAKSLPIREEPKMLTEGS